MRATRRLSAFLVTLLLILASTDSRVEAGFSAIAQLDLTGQPGDFVLNGKSSNVTYTDFYYGFNTAQIEGTLAGGVPTYLRFVLDQVGTTANTFATLDFSTAQLGMALAPGTYDNAQRASFAASGHPGLDVGFQNRGFNSLTGSFTINDVTYFHDPSNSNQFSVASFSASFTEMGDSSTGSLSGTFTYTNLASVPEPASLSLAATGIIALLTYQRVRRRTMA